MMILDSRCWTFEIPYLDTNLVILDLNDDLGI